MQKLVKPDQPLGRYGMASRLVVAVLAALLVVVGCQAGTSPSVLAENRRILASCDAAHPPASWVALDGTGSSASPGIVAERMAAVESVVRETAVCSGYLQVLVFSSSSVATVTLFDGSLRQPGATTNARLQRVPTAVAAVMATVRKAYRSAVSHLDKGGSDITAQYQLAGEWRRQLGGTDVLHLYLLTDGFQTEGVNLYRRTLDHQQTVVLARRTSVPRLPGATVVVAGLGRIAGTPPASPVVAGLVAYYNALCHRMQAAKCVAASDYQAAGW